MKCKHRWRKKGLIRVCAKCKKVFTVADWMEELKPVRNRPKWLEMMERSKATTEDWIVTTIGDERYAKMVQYYFCPDAKVGDHIVVAILKREPRKKKNSR